MKQSMMMKFRNRSTAVAAAIVAALACPALSAAEGMTATELQDKLREGESLALIDLRSSTLFEKGHVPGAMNMPVRGLNPRRLPSSRALVFYSDGLGRVDARGAAEQVSEATGRGDVHWLRGGFAAWESAARQTTRETGLVSDPVASITYHDLVESAGRDMRVLDVRTPVEAPAQGGFGLASDDGEGRGQPTDLANLLPQARIERPAAKPTAQGGGFGLASDQATTLLESDPESELVVVIDDGDGSGADLVRALRSSGNRRVVLLAGGETILRHEGRPGLGRQSSGSYVIDGRDLGEKGGSDE